jgi:hypothetical protein
MGKLIIPDVSKFEKKLAAEEPNMDAVEFEEKSTSYSPFGTFSDDFAAYLKVCALKHTWKKESNKKWMAFDCLSADFQDMVSDPDIGLTGFIKYLYRAMANIVDLMHAQHYAEPITFFIEKLDGNRGWRFILSPMTRETTEQIVRKAQDERRKGKAQNQRITKTNLLTGKREEG